MTDHEVPLPLPGLEGLDHVGMTVPDLEMGIRFYSSLLNATEIFRLGPFDSRDFPTVGDLDWSAAYVNVPDARFTLAMLELRNGSRLELFQYDRPTDRDTSPPRNCDLGGHHVAFKVSDLDSAVAMGASLGLRFMAGPIEIEEGPAAGQRIIYVLDPWGNQLELVEYDADGKAG